MVAHYAAAPMRPVRLIALLALVALLAAVPAADAATKRKPPLRVLVTNDDGIAAPGLDALVKALRKRPRVVITVVAPATNQSGTGDKVSTGNVTAFRAATKSGVKGWAVRGTPADSVRYALRKVLTRKPQLVISGINNGQNLGPFVDISGTIGAARTALRAGIPALATSQGSGSPARFSAGVKQTIGWFDAHRSRLRKTSLPSINTPTCSTGDVRGILTLPPATSFGGNDPFGAVNCAAYGPTGATDVDAFYAGYATLSRLSF
jgi:5'/3'-nucleotidase